jgi:cytoskeleton protein RodZ
MPAVVNDISEDTMLGPRREPSLDPDSSAAPSPGPTLGELLRTRREARGLTPHQAAGQLRLVPHWIEAFESNRFDALGAPVYARGYLRKYALLLELPPDEVLAKYDQLLDTPAPPPLALIKSTGSEPVTTSRAPAVIGGIALVSVAAALIIGITQMDQPVPPTATGQSQAAAAVQEPAEAAAPVKVVATSETSGTVQSATDTTADPGAAQSLTTESVAETASAELTANAESAPAPETAAATTVPATQSSSSAEADEEAESAAAAAAAEDPEQPLARVAVPMTKSGRDLKIKLSFKGKSWTTVYAADGTKLLYELSRRGRPRTVSSPPPLTVVFGAIDAVEMRVNDKNVTIPRQPGKDSIKFVLDVEDAQAGTRSADAGG